jgi:hypothetical protein
MGRDRKRNDKKIIPFFCPPFFCKYIDGRFGFRELHISDLKFEI